MEQQSRLSAELQMCLRAAWSEATASDVALEGRWRVWFYDQVASTMDAAAELADTPRPSTCPPDIITECAAALSPPAELILAAAWKQSAGRGRLERRWQSEGGRGLYLTLAFSAPGQSLGGLSIACGLAVRRFVKTLGVEATVKWPNDLVVRTPEGLRKLAGVLVDVRSSGPTHRVLLGVGLNLLRQPSVPEAISLQELGAPTPDGLCPSRDYFLLLAGLSGVLVTGLREFFSGGLAARKSELDDGFVLTGCRVSILDAGRTESGTVLGCAEDGALILETGGDAAKRIYSGTVSQIDV